VQYAVEEVRDSGIPLVVFVTGRGKKAIEDHFDVSFELEHELAGRNKESLRKLMRSISSLIQVVYVRQQVPKGLGHAIQMSRDLVGDEPFAVVLSDDIIASRVPCLKQMMEVSEHYGASVVAVQRVPRRAVSSYGIIEAHAIRGGRWNGRLFRIENMVEKPDPKDAPSDLAIIGRYVLSPGIFRALEETRPGAGGEIQLTDALRHLLKRESVLGYIFEGKRYDAGDKLGFLQATVEMALRRPDLSKSFRKYLKTLKL